MKKAGERDREAEGKAVFRSPAQHNTRHRSANLAFYLKRPLEGNIPWIFRGFASVRLKFLDYRGAKFRNAWRFQLDAKLSSNPIQAHL